MFKHQYAKLANGARVVAVRTPEFKVVTITIKLIGGPSIESKENNGISHFVEHMVLEGGRLHPDKDKFDEEIELLGGDYNGSTSNYAVGLSITVPDTHLMYGIEYLHDACFNALFPEDKLETERSAILDEIHNYETRNNKKFSDFIEKTRYTNGSAPMPVLGKRSKIQKISRNTLIEWYKKIFVPDNMAICIVGNIDLEESIKCVEQIFGGERSSGEDFYGKIATSTFSDKSIRTQVDKNEKKSIGYLNFLGLEQKKENEIEVITSRVLISILVNYRSSLLYRKLRKETGMIYSIYGNNYVGIKEPGDFNIVFTSSDEKIIDIYDMVLTELEKVCKTGFTEKEVQLGIEGGTNALKMGYTSIGQVASWYMHELFWFDRVSTIEDEIRLRGEVTQAKVNDMLKKIVNWESANIVSRVNKATVKSRLDRSLASRI